MPNPRFSYDDSVRSSTYSSPGINTFEMYRKMKTDLLHWPLDYYSYGMRSLFLECLGHFSVPLLFTEYGAVRSRTPSWLLLPLPRDMSPCPAKMAYMRGSLRILVENSELHIQRVHSRGSRGALDGEAPKRVKESEMNWHGRGSC